MTQMEFFDGLSDDVSEVNEMLGLEAPVLLASDYIYLGDYVEELIDTLDEYQQDFRDYVDLYIVPVHDTYNDGEVLIQVWGTPNL